MKVAIPVWETRVSPLFDTAQTLMIVELESGKEISRRVERVNDTFRLSRIRQLIDSDINVLVCNAISRPFAMSVAAAGIKLHRRIVGDVEEILDALKGGKILDSRFAIKCCRRRGLHMRGGGRMGRRGNWSGFIN